MKSYPQSKYPIGAKWEYRNSSKLYWIEFNRIHGDAEIWSFGYIYYDGSGYKSDYAYSYHSAKRNHYTSGRFKRVK